MEDDLLSKYRKLAFVALAAVTVFALAIGACGDDDDAGAQEDNTTLQGQVTKTQVLAAVTALRGEGLHDFDEEINAASEIDEGWGSKATRMRQTFASVDWPDELAEQAAVVQGAFDDLEAALEAEELSDAKGAVTEAHDQYHELEHSAYPYIAGEEPEEEEDHGGGDESATPEAG